MKIKITPLSSDHDHLEGEFLVDNNYYFAKFHSAGMITEIKDGDDWLEDEMSWVSRSEIPFITTLRHIQLKGPHLVEGNLSPIVRKFGPFFKIKEVDTFPDTETCRQLVYEYCENVGCAYHFYKKTVSKRSIERSYNSFDASNGLLLRAGSCLYKATILLNTSCLFAEEIYLNLFIAFEAVLEDLIIRRKFSGTERENRVKAVETVGRIISRGSAWERFTAHEEEMRDFIRNNIIHPRRHSGDINAHPFLMADFIYEDLELVDWIFKKYLGTH